MREKLRKVILVAAVIVFVVSAVQLVGIILSYQKGTSEYAKLEEEYIVTEMVAQTEPATEKVTIANEMLGVETTETTTTEPPTVAEVASIDFAALQAINPDCLGWIYIEGTMVSYPIVQATNNDYYLSHTFNGTSNSAGAIFLECLLEDGLNSKNAIIYGHNMLNGSMFGTLKRYMKQSFYNQHPTCIIFVGETKYTYEIFAAYTVKGAVSDTYTYKFGSDENFLAYIDKVKSYSDYNTGVSVGAGDKIVTLSTCTNRGADRYVVQARRVE